MARFVRRGLLLLVVLGGVLLALPAEKAPQVGQWLARAGLESRTIRMPRGPVNVPPGDATASPPLGSMDVRYVRRGQGPTVILIHGLASSIYTWAEVIGPLSQRFDVIALDLPGFGASSQPGDLGFDDYPRAVLGLMDVLGISKAHFAGNSMGGAVSLVIAARYPDRVDHVVALDPAGLDLKLKRRPIVVQLLASRAAAIFADRLPVRRLLTGATLRQVIHDRNRVNDERVDEYVAPLLRPGALDSIRSLLLSPGGERVEADLSLITSKTLVVWGRFDAWLPVSHAGRFAAAIKGSRQVILETGHMPQEEEPAEVSRLIGEFLIS